MQVPTLLSNLILVATASVAVLFALALFLIFRRKESFYWAAIILGVALLTTGKVAYQFLIDVLQVPPDQRSLGVWIREAWFVVGRGLILGFLPLFLGWVQPRFARSGIRKAFFGGAVVWAIVSVGWLVWLAIPPPAEAKLWFSMVLILVFSVLILWGSVLFVWFQWNRSDRFLAWFSALLTLDSLLILSLTIGRNYFDWNLGGGYDVVVNSAYVVLYTASAWYSYRGLKALAQPPESPDLQVTLERYGLTARELEIAHLVAEGHSNQAIGQALFIAPKTVENHLYRIYQKLGISNRIQFYQVVRG